MVAALTLAGLAIPAALLTSTGAVAAVTTQGTATTRAATTRAVARDTATTPGTRSAGPSSPVTVTITGMYPQSATASSELAISGSLTNTSKAPVSGWVVQLYASATPVSSTTEIAPGAVPYYDLAGIQQLAGVRWRSGPLQPGQSVHWEMRFRARKIGMTQFGVYPLAAVAHNRIGTVLGASTTDLPYMPGKKSPYSSTRPVREQISWLWPLIDKPMLGPSWQKKFCTSPQARALGQSLRPGGRLANLVAVGQGGAATATTAAQTAELAGRSVQGSAARGEPAQSLAGIDGVTWAVDPALLADAKALTACRSTAPGLAQAATAWLASVATATAGQPLFAMPYGDPNVVALIRQNHQGDVKNAFRLGGALACRILRRNLVPARSQASSSASAAGIAWLAGGTAGLHHAREPGRVSDPGPHCRAQPFCGAAGTWHRRADRERGRYLYDAAAG